MTGKYWDKPWSLVDGCTPCSPGCDHCWSMAMGKRFKKWPDRVTPRPDRLDIPLKTRKPTVFSVWNDLFHENVSFDFIHEVFSTMRQTPRHTYLLLTKRSGRMHEVVDLISRMEAGGWSMGFYNHVYFGVTVCNQAEADEKIPILLQTPAAHRWVSIEPMLGSIDLRNLREGTFNALDGIDYEDIGDIRYQDTFHAELGGLNCVVLGGETGPGARPMPPGWVRKIRANCAAARVPFFFKQWGKHLPSYGDIYGNWNAPPMHVLVGDKSRLLDGREHNDLPWREVKDMWLETAYKEKWGIPLPESLKEKPCEKR